MGGVFCLFDICLRSSLVGRCDTPLSLVRGSKNPGLCPDSFRGDAKQSRNCNSQTCPIDCELSDWSKWTTCSPYCRSGAIFNAKTAQRSDPNTRPRPNKHHPRLQRPFRERFFFVTIVVALKILIGKEVGSNMKTAFGIQGAIKTS